MKKILLISLGLLGLVFAQSENTHQLQVHLLPQFEDKELLLEKDGYALNGNPVQFEMLRFYLSSFALMNAKETVWKAENSHHLLDASQPNSMNISLGIPAGLEYDQITFNLGIDSATNVSGAMGGDLDPTKGMYWSWNSGYVNFKLEGTSEICPTRNHVFQYHMGGYMAPFQTVQKINLKIRPDEKIEIRMDLHQFLQKLDLAQQPTIMSPGAKAQELSEIAATIFATDE